MELNSQLHAQTAFTQERAPRYPLDRRLGGPQSRSGRCREENIPCHPQESNPGRPARSLSRYRLSYPGSVDRKVILNRVSIQIRCDWWTVAVYLGQNRGIGSCERANGYSDSSKDAELFDSFPANALLQGVSL
jgi:hypothetical protein